MEAVNLKILLIGDSGTGKSRYSLFLCCECTDKLHCTTNKKLKRHINIFVTGELIVYFLNSL